MNPRAGTNLIPNRPAYQGQGQTARFVDCFAVYDFIEKEGRQPHKVVGEVSHSPAYPSLTTKEHWSNKGAQRV